MELKVIEYEEFLSFALKNKYLSFHQIPEWGMLKEGTGWITHLLGLYDKDVLQGVTLLLEKKGPFNMNLFYAPRGFLIDMDDFELLKIFTENLKEYVKEQHLYVLKVDTNVIYDNYELML